MNLKDITDLLMKGDIHLAEEKMNDFVTAELTEGTLADVKRYLYQDKNKILNALLNSGYGNMWNDAVYADDSDTALAIFTNFVSDECGVNPNLFKKWKSNVGFIEWFNDNIAKEANITPVKPVNSYWTNFDPEAVGPEYQDTVGGKGLRSDGVTSGHREDLFGQLPSSEVQYGLENAPDNVKASVAAADADVRNRDMGADDTSEIDADGARKAKIAQNVGDNAIQRKIDNHSMVAKQNAKDRKAGLKGNGSGSFNDRMGSGTRSSAYTRKTNTDAEEAMTNRLNAARNDPSVPAWATRSSSNFADWEKENGTYSA